MPQDKRRIDVMVSSTTKDLGEHRRRVGEVVSRLRMVPRLMDLDSTSGKDGVSYSLDLVEEAEVYILLLGFRYGHVPDDLRNPGKVSITQMEYQRALEREARGELCVLPFVMADDHLLLHDHIETDPDKRKQLEAFRAAVLDKQVAFFSSIDDLEKKVLQALTQSACVLRLKSDEVTRPFEPRAGEVLERYIFEERLGQGGNGEVWRVRLTLADGKQIERAAIKLLKPEVTARPERIERFKKEISVAYRLRHPHIIRTTHWLELGAQFCAVMDYVEGQTLRQHITGRAFSVPETVEYLGQIASALDYAASKHGVVHRDVKPENILVQDGTLYLGDFGLAVSPDENESITASGELVGTKKYMAPEQWDNRPTSPQTDLYALGIIAWEMLTGSYPYDSASHARLMTQHLNTPLPAHPALPDEVLRVLRRATAKATSDRYLTATAFISDLRHWQLDPANLETKIRKYLDSLRARVRGELHEQLFVNLEGDARQIAPVLRPTASDAYSDPYLDALVRDFGVELDADHHEPESMEASYVPNILDRLLTSERVVLVGEPGAGKSFLLRRLVMLYITQAGGSVPVFVPLNAFKGVDSAGQPQTFVAYIQAQLDDGLRPYADRLLREGRLVLICDALNEMPRQAADGRNLVSEVRDLLATVPRFVVSCRVRDYQKDLDDLKLERIEVRDMDLPAIRGFIEKYLRAEAPAFWERIGGGDLLQAFWEKVKEEGEPERFWQLEAGAPSYTSVESDRAWRAMWQGARLIPLARNPYLAQVICRLHSKQRIPDNRAELYQAFVDDLIGREQAQAERRGQDFPERAALETFLTALAEQMQGQATTVLKQASITDPHGYLQTALDCTLLTLEGDDVRFTHQLLQEYFAARTLAEQMARGDDPRPLLGAAWWNLATWRETAFMLAEFTHDAPAVARWLGPASPELALETLQRAASENIPLDEATRQVLIAAALERRAEADLRGRAAAYRVLGYFNADDRPHIGLGADGLPDVDWMTIPDDGEWVYQNDKHPGLPTFQMSRYPITYRQFQAFIDDPDGWPDDRWWEGLAASAEHRSTAGNQAFKYGNHPRERVSWYDAMAFCRWWSWRLGGGYDLTKVGEWAVRLPTEYEWEKAARGRKGLIYPYGNEFDAGKGNTSETGIKQTSAVGLFPAGRSPYGVEEMSGNVWEWCLSDRANPQLRAEDEDVRTSASRTLRGGSWYGYQSYARAAYRLSRDPDYRVYGIGFRVVAGSVPLSP